MLEDTDDATALESAYQKSRNAGSKAKPSDEVNDRSRKSEGQ